MGRTRGLSRSEHRKWQGRDCLAVLSAPGDSPSDRHPGMGTEAQGQGKAQCHQPHIRDPHPKLVSYRCLEAFQIWGKDWVVDARKLLDALQDFSVVRHLETKGDVAEASITKGKPRAQVRKPVYDKRSLFSKT